MAGKEVTKSITGGATGNLDFYNVGPGSTIQIVVSATATFRFDASNDGTNFLTNRLSPGLANDYTGAPAQVFFYSGGLTASAMYFSGFNYGVLRVVVTANTGDITVSISRSQ